jgi:cation diffusion facilitator CzcD-associated flavoprotein CzcO
MSDIQKKLQTNHGSEFDAVVIGAGFAGLYMLHRLREVGFKVRVYESADGVGGVWHWNRYPGLRCDSESICYNYTFSEELYKEWTWTSKYPEQQEVLSYLNFVADKFDLRQNIQFNTRVTAAHYEEENNSWQIHMDNGETVSAKYFITAIGALSAANIPKFKGIENFQGEWYHTGRWPHEEVNFKGKRVGVIGTGSSGIQIIPKIAEEAVHLTVFQRTPQYSLPARNHLLDPEFIRQTKENYSELKEQIRGSMSGLLYKRSDRSALDDTPEERLQVYEDAWEIGGLAMTSTYKDLSVNEKANETVAEFVRTKIREIVQDPKVADKLMPSYYFGTKRPTLNTNYYETYNRDNVILVDVKSTPIEEITSTGLRTAETEYELDTIIFATGYDAMTGPLFKIDIRGKDGLSLKEKWGNGAETRTYLGIATAGFPNMFMITGPESPSVLTNVPTSIEQHVEWIGDCLENLREKGVDTIEATELAEEAWSKHCKQVADYTLFPKTDSWYTGANIADKPRGFLIYLGGLAPYGQKINDVAAKEYEGFYLKYASRPVV